MLRGRRDPEILLGWAGRIGDPLRQPGGRRGMSSTRVPDRRRARSNRLSAHLEPAPQAGVESLQRRRADEPAAGIVRQERDAGGASLQQLERVEPVGLPAVVEGVEQALAKGVAA